MTLALTSLPPRATSPEKRYSYPSSHANQEFKGRPTHFSERLQTRHSRLDLPPQGTCTGSLLIVPAPREGVVSRASSIHALPNQTWQLHFNSSFGVNLTRRMHKISYHECMRPGSLTTDDEDVNDVPSVPLRQSTSTGKTRTSSRGVFPRRPGTHASFWNRAVGLLPLMSNPSTGDSDRPLESTRR